MPETSCNGVVAGAERAVAYLHVFAATDMDSIPALTDVKIAENGIFNLIAHHGIIGGTFDIYIREREITRLSDYYSVRATHFLFAVGVENVAAVDGTFAFDGEVADTGGEEEHFIPIGVFGAVGIVAAFTAVVAAEIFGGYKGCIVGGRVTSFEHSLRREVQGDIAAQLHSAADKDTLGNRDNAAALVRAIFYGSVDGLSVYGATVAYSAEVSDVDKGPRGGCRTDTGKQKQGVDSYSFHLVYYYFRLELSACEASHIIEYEMLSPGAIEQNRPWVSSST